MGDMGSCLSIELGDGNGNALCFVAKPSDRHARHDGASMDGGKSACRQISPVLVNHLSGVKQDSSDPTGYARFSDKHTMPKCKLHNHIKNQQRC